MLLEISQKSEKNTCARVPFLIKLQVCNFIKKGGSGTGVFLWIAKFLRTPILTKHLRWLLLNVSRNLELEKQTDQNFVTQNLLHRRQYCISKKKKLLKQCQKEVTYEHILAFAGRWSIFWEVVGGGGHILAGGKW